MSGVVYFKFKSAISPDSVTFDGSFISVAELKNLIAARKGFGQDAGAELILTNPSTKEDYTVETQQIPRQTTVHVRRVPTSKPRALQAVAAAPAAAPKLVPPTQASAQTSGAVNGSAQPASDEFGADLYSEQAAASTADEEEARIRALQQGTAASWSQQVMQGGRGGRGRGRGGRAGRMPYNTSGPPPANYFCNKCGQGGHWRENCPNEGEYKRVRAPAGIPMTRLMENKEGGLYAPDGTLVSLKPNEDAFLREMAGLPSGAEQASAEAEEPKLAAPEAPAAAAAASTAIIPIAGAAATSEAADIAKPLLLDNKPHSLGTEPQLAGEGMFAPSDMDFSLVAEADKPKDEMAAFLPFGPQGEQRSPTPDDDYDRPPAQLPRGPKEYIAKAYERDEPLSQADFEALQDAARSKYHYRPKQRGTVDRQSYSPSPERSRHHRHQSRRRSISADRGSDRPERASSRHDRASDRRDSSRDRRSHRSSRYSRSPSRRRPSDRRRSSRSPPIAHKSSRSSSYRQPESRWTRSQERSSGGAVSPALSEEDAYRPYHRDDDGDRWQPRNLLNQGEVLIRPQAEEEDQAADQPAQSVAPLDAAKSSAASVDVKLEAPQSLAEAQFGHSQRSRQDSDRPSKRKRHDPEPDKSQLQPAQALPVTQPVVKLEPTEDVASPSKRAKKDRTAATAAVKVEPEASGKLAGKTFTIPLEVSERKQVKTERSPSPSRDISDKTNKKKKKHKKNKKHKKHKSKGKDRQKDRTGGENEEGDDSSDDDTPNDRQGDSFVTERLDPGASVDQVVRHNGTSTAGHGNVTMHPGDRQGKSTSLHANKAEPVVADRAFPTTVPTSSSAYAQSQPENIASASTQDNTVKKSRALFGMAMGAVLKPGSLPGVKPKKR